MRRMYQEMDSVFYYITTMNENYHQPDMPKAIEGDIIKGMYLLEDGNSKDFKVHDRPLSTFLLCWIPSFVVFHMELSGNWKGEGRDLPEKIMLEMCIRNC